MNPPKSPTLKNLTFEDLPNEIITNILLQVTDLETLANLCQTNQRIQGICQTEHFWKMKYRHDFLSAEKLQSVENLSWKEIYKLAYSTHNSPISAGVSHFAIIDNQNVLHMGGNYKYKKEFNYELYFGKLSRYLPFEQKVQSVSCGSYFTGAVTKDGKVYLWGLELDTLFGYQNYKIEKPREFKIPSRAIKITCGPNFGRSGSMFAVILEDRSVYLRMNHIFRDPNPYIIKETEVEISTILKISTGNLKALDISTNGYDLAIISTDGKLYYLGKGLGSKHNDTIGIINKDDQIEVNPLHIPLPEPIKQVSLGSSHIGVISIKGNIYMWGYDYYNQLGVSLIPDIKYTGKFFIDSPHKLPFHVPFSYISCQIKSTVAIDKNGILYGWGLYNDLPNLRTPKNMRDEIPPTKIGLKMISNDTIMTNVFNYVDVGPNFVIATTSDGVVNISLLKGIGTKISIKLMDIFVPIPFKTLFTIMVFFIGVYIS